MSSKVPSSDEIINFLIDLGFDVEDETDDFMVLTDEEFTVKIPFSLSGSDAEKIRKQLKKIMEEYGDDFYSDDEDYGEDDEFDGDEDAEDFEDIEEADDSTQKIQDWINESS